MPRNQGNDCPYYLSVHDLHRNMLNWPSYQKPVTFVLSQYPVGIRTNNLFRRGFLRVAISHIDKIHEYASDAYSHIRDSVNSRNIKLEAYITYDVIIQGTWNSKPSYSVFRGHNECENFQPVQGPHTINNQIDIIEFCEYLSNYPHMSIVGDIFKNCFPSSNIHIYEITHVIVVFDYFDTV